MNPANPHEVPLVLLAPEHSRRLEIALDASRPPPLPTSIQEDYQALERELAAGTAQHRNGPEIDRLMGLLDELDREDRFQ